MNLWDTTLGLFRARGNRTNSVRCFDLEDDRFGHGEVFVSGVGSETVDLQILAENDGADVFAYQYAVVDRGFGNARRAEPLQVLDLQNVRTGIATKEIIVQRRLQPKTVRTPVAF